MTPAEEDAAWERMEKWHDGRCAICQRTARLVIDHCHRCTLIRGLLCPHCNFEPEGLPGLAQYRENPPAKRLGVQLIYYGRGTGGYAAKPDLSYPRCGLCTA